MNQKSDPDESSIWSSHKAGQSKSLQRLNNKHNYDQILESLKGQNKQRIKKQSSQKTLKNSKFDTPEKKTSPKPHRDLQKSSTPSKLIHNNTPFPSNIQLFSKKNIGKLIKTSQFKTKASIKFNPMHLAPVLNTRKSKDSEKSEKFFQQSHSSEDKLLVSELIEEHKETNNLEFLEMRENHEIKEENYEVPDENYEIKIEDCNLLDENCEIFEENEEKELMSEARHKDNHDPNTFLYLSKAAQPSFGEDFEGDPVFLSDRISYECDSNQSPKFEQSSQKSSNWEMSGVNLSRHEKFDSETQTDSDTLEGILSFLNDHDIQTGIKFIAKIAKFVQTLK